MHFKLSSASVGIVSNVSFAPSFGPRSSCPARGFRDSFADTESRPRSFACEVSAQSLACVGCAFNDQMTLHGVELRGKEYRAKPAMPQSA
eukprot:4298476-Amphidinium_carterae.1